MAEDCLFAGRYRLVESLGRGGFSEVWQAEDSVLGRAVAVKLLTAPAGQPDLLGRFHQEARTVAGLRHPNVVVVYDAGLDGGAPYVVMELLAGPSLAGLLAGRGPLPVDVALGYMEQAAAGLAAAHAVGVVHRDIKPGNLVLAGDGTVKVVDFGIARLIWDTTSRTATGMTFGTPAYLSPEQAAGHPAEPRSDLYALGCVLFALLTGEPPFTGEHPVATAHQHLAAAAPSVCERRPDVPPAVGQLTATLLAKAPQDRPSDAATLRAWLAHIRSAPRSGTWPSTTPLPAAGSQQSQPLTAVLPPRRRRWPLAAAAAGGAAIALLLVALVALARAGGTNPARDTSTAAARPAATGAVSRTHPTPSRRTSHRVPATPAREINAARLAIVRAENRGNIQPSAAAELQNRLTDVSMSITRGNLHDAGHKAADLLHHLDDLSHNRQIGAAGLAMIGPILSQLTHLLPQQP